MILKEVLQAESKWSQSAAMKIHMKEKKKKSTGEGNYVTIEDTINTISPFFF